MSQDQLAPTAASATGGQIFTDQSGATAILDRLLHHATVANTKGQSCRMRALVPSGREGVAMLG